MLNLEASLTNILELSQMMNALGDFALPIAQINFGTTLASYIGLLQALGALGYFVLSIAQVITAFRSKGVGDLVVRILQLLLAPYILLISGGILFYNGWRLDPNLQFQQLSTSVLIGYLIFLDLKKSNRTTKQ
ncbi:MAG: Ycf66 family protein [Leptolyngbyaceae cyanobacterium MO_188.B28]|nr:Ycf66 family protein [Leptolyngbyaceae cyanobacterium MO_188.B28]